MIAEGPEWGLHSGVPDHHLSLSGQEGGHVGGSEDIDGQWSPQGPHGQQRPLLSPIGQYQLSRIVGVQPNKEEILVRVKS